MSEFIIENKGLPVFDYSKKVIINFLFYEIIYLQISLNLKKYKFLNCF